MRNFILWKWGFFVKLWGHKGIESEINYFSEWSWFDLNFAWDRKCDHAGITFSLEILGLNFQIKFYDSRHWDYKQNKWFNEGEKNE